MKFGVNIFIWSAEFSGQHYALLDTLREHGFDGAELPLIEPSRVNPGALRSVLSRAGLECTFCAVLPRGLSPIHDDAAVRARAREHLAACIEVAAEAGGTLIAGPLYAPVGYLPGRRRTDTEWNRAVECFQSLGDLLVQAGVTLAIEPLNRFETYFLNTAADAVRLCDDVAHSNVGVLFDTFHANIEEKDVAQACLSVGKHLKHVHACENDRGTPGTGHIDFDAVFRSIRQSGYDGWLTIESFGFALGELSAAASIWRDLAPSAADIAFDGVMYLKDVFRRGGVGRDGNTQAAHRNRH